MEQAPIVIFAKWQVAEGKLTEVISALAELSKLSRQESGNLAYQVHQSIEEVNRIFLFETYRDEEALDFHRNSAHYQKYGLNTIVPLLSHREVSITKEILKPKA